MKISMNLPPPYSAHSISHRVMNWLNFLVSIPEIIDMGLKIDSHTDENTKVCKNLGRSNWFPEKLIIGVVESDILSS